MVEGSTRGTMVGYPPVPQGGGIRFDRFRRGFLTPQGALRRLTVVVDPEPGFWVELPAPGGRDSVVKRERLLQGELNR
jgi:hypothetical protein